MKFKKKKQYCYETVNIVYNFSLYLTFNLAPHGGKVYFACWVWAIFFCFCANFVLLPTATAQAFGTRYNNKTCYTYKAANIVLKIGYKQE